MYGKILWMRLNANHCMRIIQTPIVFLAILACSSHSKPLTVHEANQDLIHSNWKPIQFDEKSWAYFLQHLPVIDSPVVDYRGREVRDQYKSAGIIPYDVGKADLQQCADALMRLRAEYLFGQGRHDEIGFHFVSGHYYSWTDYCKGLRPVPQGNSIRMVQGGARNKDHANLRRYLDLVYTYASTISLSRELKPANDFEVGTVVIAPGSPGHCFIIIDEMQDEKNNRYFKLAEGYTPAQSIYILRKEGADGKDPWHKLSKGVIETASYRFEHYQLRRFE